METQSEMLDKRAAERRLYTAVSCLRVAGLCLLILFCGLVGGAIITKGIANLAADQARCADACGPVAW